MADAPRVEYYLAQCQTWAPHLYTVAYKVLFQFLVGWLGFLRFCCVAARNF
jgi:hypothetical protein